MTVGRIIETPACVAEGAAWLSAQDPRFAEALALTGPLPLRRKPDGFAQLLSAIVSQQVSVASANAIWNRLRAASDIRFERSLRERSLGSVIPSGAHSEIADMMARVSLQWHHRYSTSLLVASATASTLRPRSSAIWAATWGT